jgi:hypothetical protein
MIQAYLLEDDLFNALEYIEIFLDDKKDMSVYKYNKLELIITREELENSLERFYENTNLTFEKIRRKKTTSYIFNINNEKIKLTIRYNEFGNYRSHKYLNLTFKRDLEFYL